MNDPVAFSPTAIERTESGILITWSDGERTPWSVRALRAACPCATCREKHGLLPESQKTARPLTLPVLSAAEARPLAIESMRPVGSYAYNISFSDGHHSGLFTFALLRGMTG